MSSDPFTFSVRTNTRGWDMTDETFRKRWGTRWTAKNGDDWILTQIQYRHDEVVETWQALARESRPGPVFVQEGTMPEPPRKKPAQKKSTKAAKQDTKSKAKAPAEKKEKTPVEKKGKKA
ncbi:unnamed protein product [Cladocopium goreaui]|uniref:Uncharacterized protein n=1 Tax=Cladocopium goreaui TaxID=2562237 RepID=A0A9P1CJ35_9DINO|nr:unnamed protein product [Cladocopium goreaui]